MPGAAIPLLPGYSIPQVQARTGLSGLTGAACGAGEPGNTNQSLRFTCLFKASGSVRHKGPGQARSLVRRTLQAGVTQGQQLRLAPATKQGARITINLSQGHRKGCDKRRRRLGTAPSTNASC